ncbi:hypothetical protein GUJ93_ZPchr0006g46076 [Zizania palustris]|uniref:VQ domain-containing protein n=1 Tax=Zizania palustris TaxID=103762 RepID=A0A8J5T5S3_ZIZPA|nr:hypothetical protein GUJ93_ZPchr0006g46076 [Zizania palustris]
MGECHSMSPSTALPVQKAGSSDEVPKGRPPKIKIIHIIAPEIIKTDVANFRELVQRLTGKSGAAAASSEDTPPPPPLLHAAEEEEEHKKETTTMMMKKQKKRTTAEAAVLLPEMSEFMVQENSKKKIKCEVKVEEGGFGCGLDRSELWSDLTAGEFLSFLEEDVFEDMAADFLLPLAPSRMDFVGEMYAT